MSGANYRGKSGGGEQPRGVTCIGGRVRQEGRKPQGGGVHQLGKMVRSRRGGKPWRWCTLMGGLG